MNYRIAHNVCLNLLVQLVLTTNYFHTQLRKYFVCIANRNNNYNRLLCFRHEKVSHNLTIPC